MGYFTYFTEKFHIIVIVVYMPENLELTYVPVCVPLYMCMYMYLQVVVIEILTLLESFVIHRDVSIHAEAF